MKRRVVCRGLSVVCLSAAVFPLTALLGSGTASALAPTATGYWDKAGGAVPTEVLSHPALPAACRDLAAIAERHFHEAARAMAGCSRRAMRPAAVMGAFYREMLNALMLSGWRDPTRRISLSKAQKMWLVLRHGLL